MDSPSGRVQEQGPDCFFVATEACGGGTLDLGFFSGVSVFIGIFLNYYYVTQQWYQTQVYA